MFRRPTHVLMRILLGLASCFGLALRPVSAAQIACDPGTATAVSATPKSTPAPAVDAFDEIATGLEGANPGLDITVQTAGSQTLVTQLQEGAGAAVLATAFIAAILTPEGQAILARHGFER